MSSPSEGSCRWCTGCIALQVRDQVIEDETHPTHVP